MDIWSILVSMNKKQSKLLIISRLGKKFKLSRFFTEIIPNRIDDGRGFSLNHHRQTFLIIFFSSSSLLLSTLLLVLLEEERFIFHHDFVLHCLFDWLVTSDTFLWCRVVKPSLSLSLFFFITLIFWHIRADQIPLTHQFITYAHATPSYLITELCIIRLNQIRANEICNRLWLNSNYPCSELRGSCQRAIDFRQWIHRVELLKYIRGETTARWLTMHEIDLW